MLLENVDISWVKFDSSNPDMGFDKKTPQYSCTVSTTDKKAAEEADLESLRNEFNQKLEKLHNENKELRERPAKVEERSGGFMAFAVGCAIGLLIGG